jgi:hypothetical protein
MTNPPTTRRGMRVVSLLTAGMACASLAMIMLPTPAVAGSSLQTQRHVDLTPKEKVARWGGGWLARQRRPSGVSHEE